MIVLPVTSMVRAPEGMRTWPRRPISAIRLSVTTMSPLSITSGPFMVRIRAPRSTTVPDGLDRGASTITSVAVASYAGFFLAPSAGFVSSALLAPVPAFASFCFSASSAAFAAARS
jgi:hypothetical protein